MEEGTRDWIKFLNEEVHGFTFRVMKARRMRCAGHVLCMHAEFWSGNHLESPGVGGRVVLKLALKKLNETVSGFNWLTIWTSSGVI
jgi:hypothetical protein